jgi:hypothetical protein
MGTLQMPSFMASGSNEGVIVAPPQTQAPALQPLITNVQSSNTAVINPAADLAGPAPQLTQQSYPVNQFGMAVRGPGTTTLTITWQDSTGAPTRTTTLIVVVPA